MKPINAACWDVVVVGGGHDDSVCAAYLAKAGKRVLVVERRSMVAGAAVTEEFSPGFRSSLAAYTVSLLQPKVIAKLSWNVTVLKWSHERSITSCRCPTAGTCWPAVAERRRKWLGFRPEMHSGYPNTNDAWKSMPMYCVRRPCRRRPTWRRAVGCGRCRSCGR